MPKDYNKSRNTRSSGRGGSMFVGILIGLVLGLSIALGVAWYINRMPNPFKGKPQAPLLPKIDPPKATPPPAKAAESGASSTEKSPRFTFPDILKGEGGAEKSARETDKKSTTGAKEAFFLQAGSFQNAPDADNLKARLALVGIEASIQTTKLPDKGVFHRVRVGPYSDVEELNRVRGVLKQNGVEATLVKVREADK